MRAEQLCQLQSTLKLRLDGPAWRNAANTSTQSEEVSFCCIMLQWFLLYCPSDAAVTLNKGTRGKHVCSMHCCASFSQSLPFEFLHALHVTGSCCWHPHAH